MPLTRRAISLRRYFGILFTARCVSVFFLFSYVLMPQLVQAQSLDSKGNATVEIEVAVEQGEMAFYGKFMCELNSVCSFKIDSLLVSFFPLDSIVGIALRSDEGATPLVDVRGRENLDITYDARTEVIPLYSVDSGGRIKSVGNIKVRAIKQ